MSEKAPAGPTSYEVPPSTTAIASLVADAVRALLPAYCIIVRRCASEVLPGVNAAFVARIIDLDHHFTVEVNSLMDGMVECLTSIFLHDYNVGINDLHLLTRALSTEFATPLTAESYHGGRLRFRVHMTAIF